MKKVEAVLKTILLASVVMLPSAGHARDCELPHERLEMRCGGENANSSADAEEGLSAIQKTAPAEVLQAYRERTQMAATMVDEAKAEYRAYRAKHAK